MRRMVWKFPVPIASEFTIEMPIGAEIVHIETTTRDATGALCAEQPHMWAIVEPDRPRRERKFYLRATGQTITPDQEPRYLEGSRKPLEPIDNLAHLGTFILGNGVFVGHVFEDRPPIEQWPEDD